MIDVMRVDACPRCRRGFPDDPEPGAKDADCPVCRGRPVRVIVLWNDAVDRMAVTRGMGGPHVANALAQRHQIVGEVATVAADLVERKDAACGSILPGWRPS